MDLDRLDISLKQPQLPARLTAEQTAKILGFQEHDIAILVKARLLAPLGNPAPNSPKYYAAVTILKIASDIQALDKCTRAVTRHWATKNQGAKVKNVSLLSS